MAGEVDSASAGSPESRPTQDAGREYGPGGDHICCLKLGNVPSVPELSLIELRLIIYLHEWMARLQHDQNRKSTRRVLGPRDVSPCSGGMEESGPFHLLRARQGIEVPRS